MRRVLTLILIIGLLLAGGAFYFAHKAGSSAPEQSLIRMEATNVGPY